MDLIDPYTELGQERPEVDPAGIDASGEYPPAVLDGLRRLGAFDGNLIALLSARHHTAGSDPCLPGVLDHLGGNRWHHSLP